MLENKPRKFRGGRPKGASSLIPSAKDLEAYAIELVLKMSELLMKTSNKYNMETNDKQAVIDSLRDVTMFLKGVQKGNRTQLDNTKFRKNFRDVVYKKAKGGRDV